jgi:23S rRNA (adenine2030-N6)-methyltransferase
LNYRHAFHAGNFADVFKHVVLVALLKALAKKATPFCYLDTHAGSGRYDLASEAARKTGEFEQGISRVWQAVHAPALVSEYLAAVQAVNRGPQLRFYPGSPRVARFFLRAQDRAVLLEKHPEEAARLNQEFAGDRQVLVQQQDGYTGLKAFLPPAEKRGLVLIDPPFEQANEFEQLAAGLKAAQARFAHGVYALWYPIKDRAPITRFEQALEASGIRKILGCEFLLYPADSPLRMNGCGLAIVNPPWQVDEQLRATLPWLVERLRVDSRSASGLRWIVPE